jgi:hypothetical protein
MSNGSKQAIVDYLDYKQRGIWNPPDRSPPCNMPSRNCLRQTDSRGRVGTGLCQQHHGRRKPLRQHAGLSATGGNIVTDALHFEGSLYLYDALRKQGVDVRVVPPRDWRIPMADMEKAIDKDTRLVAISQRLLHQRI